MWQLALACNVPNYELIQVESADTGENATDTTTEDSSQPAVCGDELVTGLEECDLGPQNSDSGACTSTCALAVCGDGLTWEGVEACDDQGTLGGDGCTPTCQLPGTLTLDHADRTVNGIFGNIIGHYLGHGDLNGDGLSDLLLGSPSADYGAGAVYISYGGAAIGTAPVDYISGIASSQLGFSVAGVGDLDGDGADEIVIGAQNPATAFLIRGAINGALTVADADATLTAEQTNSRLGWSVSGIGDVNLDGVGDILVGAPSMGPNSEGAVNVVSGDTSGVLVVEDGLATINGVAPAEQMAWSIAGCKDIDGDGVGDFIAGAPFSGLGAPNGGAAYLLHGPFDGVSSAEDADAILVGDSLGLLVGWSVACPDDLNDDGITDLVIGTNQSGTAGPAYAVSGDTKGLLLPYAAMARFDSMTPGAGSVAAAGDVDGNGVVDIMFGAPASEDGGALAGAVYLMYGGLAPGAYASDDADERLLGVQGSAGGAVAAAGDTDGDGLDDIVVGSPVAGTVYLVLGSSL